MKIIPCLDKAIEELEKAGTPAEHVIMGKKYFYDWVVELTRSGDISFENSKKKYKFTHRGVKIVLCESEILEVVPNSKYLLD